MENNVRKISIYMYDWVTLLYSRNLTEHCKLIIMEKNKNHLKKPPKKPQNYGSDLSLAWELGHAKRTSENTKEAACAPPQPGQQAWLGL